MQGTKIVAISYTATGENVTLMNMGGQDISKLTEITVSGDLATDAPTTLGKSIGNSNSYELLKTGQNHVVVVGTFGDSSEQVLLDIYVNKA
jgi:hypothetical protein